MNSITEVIKKYLTYFSLFSAFSVPFLYVVGIFFYTGWEEYWGIPQGIFEPDFNFTLIMGMLFSLTSLWSLFSSQYLYFAIALFILLRILGIDLSVIKLVIVVIKENIYKALLIISLVLLSFFYVFDSLEIGLISLLALLLLWVLFNVGKRFINWLKKLTQKKVPNNQSSYYVDYHYANSGLHETDPIKIIFPRLIAVIAILAGSTSFIVLHVMDAGCEYAENRAFSMTDREWVKNHSIRFKSQKNKAYIPLECNSTFCAVIDYETFQVKFLKTKEFDAIIEPRKNLIIKPALPKPSNFETHCKLSLSDLINGKFREKDSN